MRLHRFSIEILGIFFLSFAWAIPADGQVLVWKAGQKQFPNANKGEQASHPLSSNSLQKRLNVLVDAP